MLLGLVSFWGIMKLPTPTSKSMKSYSLVDQMSKSHARRLNTAMTPIEAHAVLYTIEQSLMRGSDGKKYEWTTAGEAADPLAQLFQDYDWADEVLHVHIGRKWGLSQTELTREEFVALGREKAVESEAVLARYADPVQQVNWWPEFVRHVLGKPSAMPEDRAGTSDPVYNKDY